MKITRLKIEGREYLLCCPIYVMKEMNEHFGGMDKIDEALSQSDLSAVIDESMWILSTLMKAGERYAEKNGLDHNKALSVEQLQDLCDISTLFDIRENIFDVLSASAKQEVELEPAKNQDTTSGGVAPAWYLYYALKIGLTIDEFMWLDYGTFMDLVAIEKIRNEGAKLKTMRDKENYDEIVIPDIP